MPVRVFHSVPGLAMAFLFPVVLWAMLWLGLQSGPITDVFNAENPIGFLHGLRSIFPFAAAWLAIIIMLAKVSQQRPRGFRFFGPLGLTVVYGLVGIAAAFLSPDISVSLRWAILYLSVPLVLWAVVWGNDPLGKIGRIIALNWLLVLFGVAALFVFTLIYLDLGSILLRPGALLQCQRAGSWFISTAGLIRGTGVGRFAAVTAIVAFSLLLRGNWRILWIAVLVLSLSLLMTTGARTSLVGLAAAVPVVGVLHGGKNAIIVGALAIAVLVPVLLSTGYHETFLRGCVLRGWDAAGISYLNMRSPPSLENPAAAVNQPVQDQVSPPKPLRIIVASEGLTLRRVDREQQDGSATNNSINLPSGEWVRRQILPEDELSFQNALPTGDAVPASTPAIDAFRPDIPANEQIPLTPTAVSDIPDQVAVPPGTWELRPPSDPSGEDLDTLTTFTLRDQGWLLERVQSSIPADLQDAPSLEQAGVGADQPSPK